MQRFRVEVWVSAIDGRRPYVTLRTVTFRTARGVMLFCAAVEIIARLSGDPRQLPRIADVVMLH